MLQKIRAASLVVTIGSFLVLGLSILVSDTTGLAFLPNWPWIYPALLVLSQALIVGFFLGIGTLVGVSFDIWTAEKYSSAGKASSSLWWLAGAVFGIIGGVQILSQILR